MIKTQILEKVLQILEEVNKEHPIIYQLKQHIKDGHAGNIYYTAEDEEIIINLTETVLNDLKDEITKEVIK